MLLAGKYLNVIRECGIEVAQSSNQTKNEVLSLEEDKYVPFAFPTVEALTSTEVLQDDR